MVEVGAAHDDRAATHADDTPRPRQVAERLDRHPDKRVILVKREFGQILVRVVRSRRPSDGLVRRQEPPHQGETDHPRRGGDEADVGDFENAETLHPRSEEHTSELQSLMRISYAVFCLKKKTIVRKNTQAYTH